MIDCKAFRDNGYGRCESCGHWSSDHRATPAPAPAMSDDAIAAATKAIAQRLSLCFERGAAMSMSKLTEIVSDGMASCRESIITAPAPASIPHAHIIEPMRAIAKRHGWALGVHGSLVRDIDLIAVPWTSDASDWTAVYDAWLAELPLQDTEGAYRDRPPHRPHNRKSVLILQRDCVRVDDGNPKGTWNPPCLDVSFMIPQKAPAPVTVSDEMVDAACNKWCNLINTVIHRPRHDFNQRAVPDDQMRMCMRAALEAYESARGAGK